MNKKLIRILSLALCAALLCALPAFAAEPAEAEKPNYLAPVQVWGQVTRQENGSLLLQNADENDPYSEIVLHLTENTPVVDAVTSLPLTRELRDGETVYAWAGPAMTLSLPPQASAKVVVANIPADSAVPQYVQIARVEPRATIAIYPPPPVTRVDLVTTDGKALAITDSAALAPWLTKQMVTLESLTPGSELLVWRDAAGAVTRVLLFAYAYQGYLSWETTGEVLINVNNQYLPQRGKVVNGEVLLPIRAVAEAAGYDVTWVAGQGAVVSRAGGGSPVFSVLPGQTTARTADGDMGLSGACLYEVGATYLPAEDLAYLLNLFRTY